jgi:hypothetical protein
VILLVLQVILSMLVYIYICYMMHNLHANIANININNKQTKGPTATSFLAYLNTKKKAKHLYKMKDKAQYGWRTSFKRLHESIFINPCSETGRRLSGGGNVTVCRDIEDPVECDVRKRNL